MIDIGSVVLIKGKSVDPVTGLLSDAEGCWTNWEPVEIGAGSTIAPAYPGIVLRIWCYMKSFDGSLAHEYLYDEESNWTTLSRDVGPSGEFDDPDVPWHCPVDCFVRITARTPDGHAADTLADVARLRVVEPALPETPDVVREEIDRVCNRVNAVREAGDLTLIVLSDVHYSTGCIWPETARNIREVAARIQPDAIVQLGDVSDGIAPVDVTLSYVERVLGDLHSCGVPVYSCVGNHDVNYFKGNDDLLTSQDCARLYTGHDELWYYEDFPDAHVRCFFLHSFDPLREQRYGFAAEEVEWLAEKLAETPVGWSVLVFSHLPLYADIHFWSDTILNEKPLANALERFNQQRARTSGAVMGFIHGHSHVDQVFRRHSFPDISIGCAKFEDFTECKPFGSTTPGRKLGEASQDLWDVLVLKRRENRLELIRFGAGDDESVTAFMKPPLDVQEEARRVIGKLRGTPLWRVLRHMPGKRVARRMLGGRI